MAEKAVSNDFHPIPQTPLSDKKVQLTYDPETKTTKLYVIVTVGGVQTAKSELYNNGIWNTAGQSQVSDDDERKKIHQKIIDNFESNKKNYPKGLPEFVTKNTPSQDTITGGGTQPSQPQGALNISIDTINNLLGILTLDPNKINEKLKFGNVDEVIKGYKNLQYPIDALYGGTQDHLVISMFKYKPPAFDALFGKKDGFKDIINEGLPRGTPLKEYINSVKLPMPNSISDSNNVSWGEGDSMNNLSAALTSYVPQNMMQALIGQTTAAAGGKALGLPDGLVKIYSLLKTLDQMDINYSDPNIKALLNTSISSKLIENLGFSVSPETILSRGFGIVPNSNIELLFNSPTLRDFSFQYRLSPRSKEEALRVNQIIRFFKQGMAAKKLDGKGGAQSYFLGTPNVFKLRYRTEKNKQISGVNKIKVCALTGFSVNYAADGNWAAYDEGQPVSSIINMSFKELEPIYDTDYQTDIDPLRLSTESKSTGDLDSVGPNDVGY